jgi:hypothetical protein
VGEDRRQQSQRHRPGHHAGDEGDGDPHAEVVRTTR